MKQLLTGLIAATTILFTACNTDGEIKETTTAHDMENMKDMPMSDGSGATLASNSQFGDVFAHYQHVTFALSNDDSKEAANGAKAMEEALTKVDKSGFSAEQLETFADLETDIKEHTQHIRGNAGNIDHQREHLETLSKDVYDIAKSFGAGKTMYKIYCPMYNNNKGAYWLAESKEVKNPYFGSKMLTCGEVQEEIK